MPAVTLRLYGDPMTMNELVRLAKAGKAGKAKGIAYIISDEIDRWSQAAEWEVRKLLRTRTIKPLPTPVEVTCWHLRTHHGVIDTMAPALACKSAVDGAVRGGLIKDDRDTLVTSTSFPAHKLAAREGIEVRFASVAGATIQEPLT